MATKVSEHMEKIEPVILAAGEDGITIPELIQRFYPAITDGSVRFAVDELKKLGRVVPGPKKKGKKKGSSSQVYTVVTDPQAREEAAKADGMRRLAHLPKGTKKVKPSHAIEDLHLHTSLTLVEECIKAALRELNGLEFQPPEQQRLSMQTIREQLFRALKKTHGKQV